MTEHISVVTSRPTPSVVAVDPVSPTAAQLVGDIMTRSVVAVDLAAPFKEILLAMTEHRISTIPVLDDERRVVGVVTASDLLARLSGEHGRAPRGHRLAAAHETTVKARGLTARELMTEPAVTTTEDESIQAAATTMAHARVRCLPVVDDDARLIGIATKTDLVKIFLRVDETIRTDLVNHVLDEILHLEPDVVTVSVDEGVVTLSGRLERRLAEVQLLELVRSVPGVVGVDSRLTYAIDDTIPRGGWPYP